MGFTHQKRELNNAAERLAKEMSWGSLRVTLNASSLWDGEDGLHGVAMRGCISVARDSTACIACLRC